MASPELIYSIVKVFYGALALQVFVTGEEILRKAIIAGKIAKKDPVISIFLVAGLSIIIYGIYVVVYIITDLFTKHPPLINFNLLFFEFLKYFIVLVMLAPINLISIEYIHGKNRFYRILQIFFTINMMYLFFIFGLKIFEIIIPNYLGVSISTLGIIGFYVFFRFMLVDLQTQPKMQRSLLFAILAFLVCIGGEILQIIGRIEPPTMLFVIGTAVEIIGWILLRYVGKLFPAYNEFEWRSGLIECHVIMLSGISVYHGKFDISINTPNSELVGGGIIGVKTILGEITQESGQLKFIQIGEKYLVFQSGKYIIVSLLCKQNYGIYHSLVKELVEKIERENPALANFRGDIEHLSIEKNIKETFDSEMQSISL